jgi:hypothetical protein
LPAPTEPATAHAPETTAESITATFGRFTADMKKHLGYE